MTDRIQVPHGKPSLAVRRDGGRCRDSRPIPTCHPDRRYYAEGLCSACYFERRDERIMLKALRLDSPRFGLPLSAREEELLTLVAAGHLNKTAAVALGISEQTVKNHMSAILAKLGVHDRTQAVMRWKDATLPGPGGPTADQVDRFLATVEAGLIGLRTSVRQAIVEVRRARRVFTEPPEIVGWWESDAPGISRVVHLRQPMDPAP